MYRLVGPPLPAEWKQFLGESMPFDVRVMFSDLYHDPEKIPAKVAEMQCMFEQAGKQKAN